MNLKVINDFISNEKSKELYINIIVNDKTYIINSIKSDFKNEILKIYAEEQSKDN
jgi:hypothetical protein